MGVSEGVSVGGASNVHYWAHFCVKGHVSG